MQIKTALMPHQQQAYDKLIRLKVGALYMEMGTGKTLTALAMAKTRIDKGKIGHVLWMCPCSVKQNLKDDIIRHSSGAMAHIAIYGIESLSASRKLMDVLVRYCGRMPTMLIVDESNLVKNPQAVRSKRMEELAKLCPYRLILNGTPISKNEADLYQQWKILDSRILGYSSFWSFARNHLEYDKKYKNKVRRVLNIDYITDKISPYAYMVKKEDVLKLPGKHYSCKNFNMGMFQEAHYDSQMDRFLATLIDDDDEAAIYRTFTVLQEITSGRRIVSDTDEPLKHEPFYARTEDNPRIRAIMDAVAESPDEKTVIWCKFQHEADDIVSVLTAQYGGGIARMLTGKLSPKARDESIRAFRDGGARYLVANKTCAGYGLNLQFCRRAIYYDNDWSWATRAQSEDRIHRIGQAHDVEIIDLCCAHSIDQRILDCLARKTRISDNFKAAVKGKNARQWLKGKDIEEVKE